MHEPLGRVKASLISKQLGIREKNAITLVAECKFIEAVRNATERMLTEIFDTHRNLSITSQKIIGDAFNSEK